jgi:hypothetical protein
MRTFLPSIFSLFSNVTDAEFKATFQPPCRFEQMLELFQGLPPYFEQMAEKFPNDPELLAYYSMQLASTVLVNNGSLTMRCMYSMLTLQSKLNDFSLKIMDKPNEHRELVGHFGVFMQPIMSKLKDNAMMKIIEHVERYDKNDNTGNIYLFQFLNFIYCLAGLGAILANVFLIILLKQRQPLVPAQPGTGTMMRVHGVGTMRRLRKQKRLSTYEYLVQCMNKRYKTRICLIIIAACHSIYIFINFMVMSQASLAAVALQGLTKLNLACKMAFFISPPTTIFNIFHQLAIWLLVYAIRQHAVKIRTAKTHLVANYELIDQPSSSASSRNHRSKKHGNGVIMNGNSKKQNIYMSDSMIDDFSFRDDSGDETHKMGMSLRPPQSAVVALNNTNGHHHHHHHHHQSKMTKAESYTSVDEISSDSCVCYFFEAKRKNALFCLCLLFVLLIYNFQNFIFYSLSEMENNGKRVSFCAFDEFYAAHYTVISQYLVPVLNLFLFCFLPLIIAGVQVALDVGYLIRLRREQTKYYNRLDEEHIEWPLYFYFLGYVCVFLPMFVHQLLDLAVGTKKFPFVFPLFIQLKFSSRVWLVVWEMTSLFVLCAADLFIWLAVDKNFRLLAICWLKKYVLCVGKNKTSGKGNKDGSGSAGSASSGEDKTASGGPLLGSGSASGSASTPISDSTEASSAKTSSELCAINDNCAEHVAIVCKSGKESGNTGTISSTASQSRKKQLLLPNITDAIKQTAAIPAGMQHNSVYPYESALDANEHNFKMIDTEIDHIAESYVVDANGADDDDDDDDFGLSGENEEAAGKGRKYKMNYENVHPPSFKTAISRMQQQQQQQHQLNLQNQHLLNVKE